MAKICKITLYKDKRLSLIICVKNIKQTTTGAETFSAHKKITLATFKSFVRKNAASLFVNQKSSFDGMTDCIESRHGGFNPAQQDDDQFSHKNTLGLRGLWLVGHSRDYFNPYEDERFIGIEVYNSCGKSIVAIAK
jgi:hypothetical protein